MNEKENTVKKNFKIEMLKKCDLNAAAELEAQCFSHPWTLEMFEESLRKKDYCFFAAKKEEKLVGCLGAYITLDELNITDIAVAPQWRRLGVAWQLLERLDEFANDNKISGITLEVRVSNAGAIALYEKKGYRGVGVRKNFYDTPREDALIMWKYL